MQRLVNKKNLFMILSLISFLVLHSCVPSSSTGNRRSTSSEEVGAGGGVDDGVAPGDPVFSSNLNFFQNGNDQTSSSFILPLTFTNSFFVRGPEIHNYISNGNTNNVRCLVAHFPSSTDRQILIFAASPQSTNATVDGTVEYYYFVEPANESRNQTFCLKTGILNALSSEFPGKTNAFSLATLCPSCTSSTLISEVNSLRFMSDAGIRINNIDISYVTFLLSNTPGGQSPGVNTCTNTSQCQAIGFDCCSNNQCVNDKTLRSGINTSSTDFIQALQDINSNPANIVNYPQFYHLCPIQPIVDPTPTPTPNPQDEVLKRFTELQELFECTNPVEGEMSLCTVTFENASPVAPATVVSYQTGADDRSFNTNYTGGLGITNHSINRIIHAGETLFEDGVVALNPADGDFTPAPPSPGNDNFTDTHQFNLRHVASASAPDDTLKIRYRIDGSCEQVTTNLGQCEKHYVQGQNLGRITDHFPASNQFSLPLYANTTRTIKVEVNGIRRQEGLHWNLIPTSPAFIEFIGAGLQVQDTQNVKITFFVDTAVHNFLQQKRTSLDRIQSICSCTEDGCATLREVFNQAGTQVIDYECEYADGQNPSLPLQQTVILDSKSVPHRFYDNSGVEHSEVTFSTPPQEGIEFNYANNNLLLPNNASQYVGFNEIYGSFTTNSGSAKPAKTVAVESGKTYQLTVNQGQFFSCINCGTDYYANLADLFPSNFSHRGGGYFPDATETNRSTAEIRRDDLIFGRACFVPATMIPWTHVTNSNLQTQRSRRLAAQHFLFANGYQRDWYGFDYGSVIGSFDGVTWFSVGNKRQIRATTNKLFLAINAYFGDLTNDNSFSVTVTDTSNAPNLEDVITNDFDTDGAQCQQFHTCERDSDCAAKLGWDYSCQSISNLTTPWPVFDENAQEVPGEESISRLSNLFSANLGSNAKRCVYRAQGSPCSPNYQVSTGNSYAGTDSLGIHACSANTYCQAFTQGGQVASFNNRIARFGRSVLTQNASTEVTETTLDTFGLGARFIGRPFSYNGTEAIPSEAQANLSNNNISAMCIPGKNPDSGVTLLGQNERTPSSSQDGDQVLGIGMTSLGVQAPEYLSSCSIFDSDGNYFNLDQTQVSDPSGTTNATLTRLAGTQAMPTNALSLIESLSGNEITRSFDSEHITTQTLQENRCLRAPGSVCHTNFDCSPSNFIATRAALINSADTSLHSILNPYEIKFWQEELICSQDVPETDPNFDLSNNRCCRDVGNTLSIGTLVNQSAFPAADPTIPVFDNTNIPSLGIALNSSSRYSRMAPVHSDMASNPTLYPPLQSARDNTCNFDGLVGSANCQSRSTLTNQFKTFGETAARTCCTKNWVRNFHASNGGGHTWSPSKMQSIAKENFKCLNWFPDPTLQTSGLDPFTCANADDANDPDCTARSTSLSQANVIFDWLNTLELLGIPQIAIKTDDFPELDCSVDPNDHSDVAGTGGTGIIVPGLVQNVNIVPGGNIPEYQDPSLQRYYSATDMDNFDNALRPIFSEDEVSCCLPAGSEVQQGDNPNICCSGFINEQTSRCALPDFSNVSLYFNAYVSSEAQGLNDSQFDQETGFLRNASTVESLACQKQVCASGVIMRGVALSNLKVTGQEGSDILIRRFIDSNTQASNFSGLADLYDSGLRWNNNVYCVPAEIEQLVDDSTTDLAVINCNTSN